MSMEERLINLERHFQILIQLAGNVNGRMDALTDAQANSEARIAALADAQIRTEEALARLADAQASNEGSIATLTRLANDMDVRLAAVEGRTGQP